MPVLHRLLVLGPEPLMAHLDLAFEGDALGTAMFVVEERVGLWRFEAWFDRMPSADWTKGLIEAAEDGAGMKVGDWQLAPVPDIDWVGEAQKSFVPIHAGRFFLHASTWEGKPPIGAYTLTIDAATAFGTGEHATTQGCLTAISDLLLVAKPKRILDLGCGTGVLGLGLARAGCAPILMTDIDPRAERVARGNARINGLAARVKVATATGMDHRLITTMAPYDLIVANILARPLAKLSTRIAAALVPGGRVVLSGLIATQERWIRAAYRNRGMVFERAIRKDGWVTLVLRKPD